MFLCFFFLILKFIISNNNNNEEKMIEKLTLEKINKYYEKKNILFILYINPNKTENILLLKKLYSIQNNNKYKNLNFGFVDITTDSKMLKYFQIENLNKTGIIIYNFKNRFFYIKENINNNNVNEIIENIIIEIINNKLNWNSNSFIEKILFLFTGKRFGKKIKEYLLFISSLFLTIFYTIYKIYLKRKERENIIKMFKKD